MSNVALNIKKNNGETRKDLWITKEEFRRFVDESDNNLNAMGKTIDSIHTMWACASSDVPNEVNIEAFMFVDGVGDKAIDADNSKRINKLEELKRHKIIFTKIVNQHGLERTILNKRN